MKLMNQKGAAVVEFAVVLPLLLLIVFGIIEFGFILYNKAMLTNATREGARGAILATSPRSSTNAIADNVELYAEEYMFNFSEEEITTEVYLSSDGSTFSQLAMSDTPIVMTSAEDYIRVTASYDYNFLILPNFVKGLGISKSLIAYSTMRAE